MNTIKIVSTLNAIKVFIEYFFPIGSEQFSSPLFQLIFQCEQGYKNSPSDFVTSSKILANWIKVSYLTGIYTLRDTDPKAWVDEMSSPRQLYKIVDILTNDEISIEVRDFVFRMAYSILCSYKVVVIPSAPNYDSIILESTAKEDVYSRFDIEKCLHMLGTSKDIFQNIYKKKLVESKWHLTSSSGPNGQAVWNSHIDAKALIRDINLFKTLEEFSEKFEMDYLLESLYALESTSDEYLKLRKKTPRHSKLHHIFEKGNKCRIIGIVDYFTQEALGPLHDTLAETIRNIDPDVTFAQDEGFIGALNLSEYPDTALWSFDLSSATDRLPIELSQRILTHLTSHDKAQLWRNLLTKRVFYDNYGNHLTYNCGQAMGIKTSFPMLALTHHVIVQQAAILAGHTKFESYVLLGDDIVIANKSVAEQYKSLIKDLGINISEHKSITPGLFKQGFEFASRLGFKGKELSPLPVKLLAKVMAEPAYSADLQNELHRRQLLSEQSFWLFISAILPKSSIVDLARLNGLPNEITGLRKSLLPPQAKELHYEVWTKNLDISKTDIINYYNYVVVSDSLIKLDRLLKKSISIENILAESFGEIGIKLDTGIEHKGTDITLLEFVEKDLKNDILFKEHPVRKIMDNEGHRISEVLSDIMSGNISLTSYAIKKLVNSLSSSLTDIRFTPDTDITISLRRRVIEKVVNLLKVSVINRKEKSVLTQTFNFPSINQMWLIKVGLGIRLQVTPILRRQVSSKSESESKLSDSLKNIKF